MKTIELLPELVEMAITPDYVNAQLKRLFNALQDATDNPGSACLVIEKLSEAIESDPQLSRVILTPENIGKAMELKVRSETGKLKLKHITAAYPAIEKHFPMVSMLETFGL